jgi:feruloyl esterase
MRTRLAAVFAIVCGALPYAQTTPANLAACARLAQALHLPETVVTAAQEVAGGQFQPPAGSSDAFKDLPPFCRVSLTIKPSSDSDIRSEVWLPLSGWNGKFLMVGNGAWGGSIQYGALANGVGRGYAVASTDTGHTGSDASFAMGHPEKLVDFAYRSVHETALQGKATVAALYGSAPRLSYFDGCSGGGRQAFMEAQRFPDDFDAIIAGAPGYNRTSSFFQMVMLAQATLKDPASFIPSAKYPAIHRAALDACDAKDGAADGLVSDPLKCSFDPAAIACTGEDGPACLTAPQVAAARRIYAPVVHPQTGEEIFPGLEPGSELRWGATSGGPRPLQVADDLFKFVIFQDPQWDFRTLDIEKHLPLARKIDGGMLSPTSTDIHRFIARGGKLLMYHGWADQNISPRSTVNYFAKLKETLGASVVANSVALYMVPGMGHCGGGEGPAAFDMLSALEGWREHGQAPAEILATQRVGDRVGRTRPLCRFPLVPGYKGTGSLDRAESFVCRQP